MKKLSSIVLIGFAIFTANAVQAGCRSVFNEIKSVVSSYSDLEDYAFVYSYNKVRWEYDAHHGGYSTGNLQLAHDGHLTSNAITYTQSYFGTYDQSGAVQRVGDAIFDFYPDGRMALTLPEWGNVAIDVKNATCYSDSFGHYVTGMRREGNGTATVGITFQKQTTLI